LEALQWKDMELSGLEVEAVQSVVVVVVYYENVRGQVDQSLVLVLEVKV
jgi:hypothetical protein